MLTPPPPGSLRVGDSLLSPVQKQSFSSFRVEALFNLGLYFRAGRARRRRRRRRLVGEEDPRLNPRPTASQPDGLQQIVSPF